MGVELKGMEQRVTGWSLLCIIDFLFLWLYIIFLTLICQAAMSQRMTHASKTGESTLGRRDALLQISPEGLHVVAQCQTPIHPRGNKCNFPRLLFNRREASVSLGVPRALPRHRY